MRRAIVVIIVSVLVFMVFPNLNVFADDGYMGGVGQNPIPGNSKDIVMESEVVNIVLHEGFSEVECAYKFRNEGNDQVVQMGFPNKTSLEYEEFSTRDLGISVFEALVDGIKIPVKTTTVILKPGQPEAEQYGEKSSWFTHEVPFKKGETKIVVNRYIAPHGVTASPESAAYRHFDYVIRTGSSWKGIIGKAVVNVRFASGFSWDNFVRNPESYKENGEEPPENNNAEPSINPKGYKKNANGLSWSFTQLEPRTEDDISIGFYLNLRKTGPNTRNASASSWLDAGAYKYPAEQAADDNINTAWAEGAPGSGIGESIKTEFNYRWDYSKAPGRYDIVKVDTKKTKQVAEIRILPGYAKSIELFKKYSRPKTATVSFSDGTSKQIILADEPTVQYFALDKPIQAKWAKLRIDDVYMGSVGQDTYISEIEFGSSKTLHLDDASSLLNKMSTKKPSSSRDSVKESAARNRKDANNGGKNSGLRDRDGTAKDEGNAFFKENAALFVVGTLLLGLAVAAGIGVLTLKSRKPPTKPNSNA